MEFVGEVDGILEGLDGVVECDGSSGEVLLLGSSDSSDGLQVLSALDQEVLSGGQLSLGLGSLDGASVQLVGGIPQDVGGISDLGDSE